MNISFSRNIWRFILSLINSGQQEVVFQRAISRNIQNNSLTFEVHHFISKEKEISEICFCCFVISELLIALKYFQNLKFLTE
jgi:hypothetical protein